MPPSRQLHRTSTVVMSILMIIVGIAMLVRTLISGGGVLASGLLLGVLFIAAGAGRIYLAQRGS